jgi:HEAT repeat protein
MALKCICVLAAVAILVPPLSRSALAQSVGEAGSTQLSDPAADLKGAESNLKSGSYSMANLETLAVAKDRAVVPALVVAFDKETDETAKAKLASTLIRIGTDDAPYWDFLERSVSGALADMAPNPLVYDQQGHLAPGPSPAFERWALNHYLSLADAADRYFYYVPGLVLCLAQTEKPRAVPLLMTALASTNPLVQIDAAKGLAQMKVKAAIPLIIAASDSAPADVRLLLAESLIYFDDPVATKAAIRLIPAEQRAQFEAARARGVKPLR